VDAAVLVPNCPVCHQTISLVARHLEANGISTVVMGCAKDIVEHTAVPRFLFSDFPLGNSAGKPHDAASQGFTLDWRYACSKQRRVRRPPFKSPLRWSADASWKRDYNNVAMLSADELARRRREFDAQKEIAADCARARRKVKPRPAPEFGRFPPRSVYVNAAFCRLRPSACGEAA